MLSDEDVKEIEQAIHRGGSGNVQESWLRQLIDDWRKMREAVREHMRQEGHSLCWRDNEELWAKVLREEARPFPHASVPPREEFLARCEAYHASLVVGAPWADAEPDAVKAHLQELWEGLTTGADEEAMAYVRGAIHAFAAVGLLSKEHRELWERRIETCPGHGGGQGWCAYCGKLEREVEP